MTMDGYKFPGRGIIAGFSIFLFLAIFILLFLFFNTKEDRYNFFLYLYGDTVSPGAKALVKIISKDGEAVPYPEIYINGTRTDSHLIDLRPDLKEISVKVGQFESFFPISYKMIENGRKPEKKFIQFSENELRKAPVAPFAGTKNIFLLPEQFRAVPEFEFTVNLFCLENNDPCQDKEISVNGAAVMMENGYAYFSSVYKMENSIAIAFSDGTAISAEIPYTGKMLRFFKDDRSISIASLTEVNNVHLDCYSKNKWLGTDILKISSDGIELPLLYNQCDTIQASLNSASPGSTFTVTTELTDLQGEVTDTYYAPLAAKIDKFSPSAKEMFTKNYNSSFFRILPVIFSGEVLEKEFNLKQQHKLDTLWWTLMFFAAAGFVLFAFLTVKKISVIEGEDGELISYSLNRQRFILAIAFISYITFFAFLLYLLKNLA